MLQRVLGHPFTISGVERKPERVQPPQLYDLTELQRDMNRRYGMSADATLKAAQSLYESKLISYPRTDSRYLGSDLKSQIPGILADLQPLKPVEIGKLDLQALAFTGRIINDAKVSDHHAIIPTGKRPGDLAPAAQKVFDAVVTRLIAVFYPACVKEVTTVSGTSNEVPFRAKGVRVLDPGWTVLYPRKDDDKKEERPGAARVPPRRERAARAVRPSRRDDAAEVLTPRAACSGRWRRPASWWTTSSSRKRSRSGAWARPRPARRSSRPCWIAATSRATRRTLAATDLGRYLVAIVRDRGLKSPELTGDWEAKLRQVERGELDRERIHGGDRPVHGRGDPLRRRGRGRPGTARRLPAMRPSGDRGQARTSAVPAGAMAARSCSGASTGTTRSTRTKSASCSSIACSAP